MEISQEISDRICAHMNKDHKDALTKYVTIYSDVKGFSESTLCMTRITNSFMTIKVNGSEININLKEKANTPKDIHNILIAMLKET